MSPFLSCSVFQTQSSSYHAGVSKIRPSSSLSVTECQGENTLEDRLILDPHSHSKIALSKYGSAKWCMSLALWSNDLILNWWVVLGMGDRIVLRQQNELDTG